MDTPTVSCRMQVSELQQKLARKATHSVEHRFTHLFDLLTWPPLLVWAFDLLMTHPGSRTAGIDGLDKRTALKNKQAILRDVRAALKSKTYAPQPVRRVYIPKANGKRRALGIPTLVDRMVQLMVKAILEPIFESDFRPSSHGFRPQRSCHTAMAYLHQQTAPRQKKMYWTVEGDIVGYFDHVQHQVLIRLLRRRVQDNQLLHLITQMLRAGVMEGQLFAHTPEGVPQGGTLSPLLANVYLHELDCWFERNYTGLNANEKNRRRQRKAGNAFYVRYADDFVVAWNGTKAGAAQLKTELSAFFREQLQLELSEDKSRITHVTDGYDFLGFTVKRVIDAQRGYDELLTYPSKKSVMRLKAKIKAMTKHHTTLSSVTDKLDALNNLRRGWANYFQHSAASQTFNYIDSYTFARMEIWLRHKTRRGKRAIYRQYYQRHHGYLTWCVGETALQRIAAITPIRRLYYAHRPNPFLSQAHQDELSYHLDPFVSNGWDGTVTYGQAWSAIRNQVRQRDENRCQLCGSNTDLEVHHVRKHRGQRPHDPTHLITLCGYCHRKVRDPQSEQSRSLARRHPEAGKPDDGKLSYPVWEEA